MSGTTKIGSKLYISTTAENSALSESEFEALVYTEIDCVITLPDFGITDNIVSQDCINGDVTQKQKGFKSASDTEIVISFMPGDAGQDALRAAAATKFNYAFKLESADAPDASTTNTIRYSRGIVGGPNFAGGGGEEFDNETYSLGLNQSPILVKPEAI
jgi:hypothetical protein